MYVVSRCLLGVKCKYNGGHNLSPEVVGFLKDKEYITICPETMGGLDSPRPPAEIQADGSVVNSEGIDVTAIFELGAQRALAEIYRALLLGADETACIADLHAGGVMRTPDGERVTAILKANSPSCGCGQIYDGTFSGRTVPGDGIAAALLRRSGIKMMTEKDFEGE